MADLLSVEDLAAGYAGNSVLSKINFTIQPGTVSLFIGANGAGKSTLGQAIVGLCEVYGGHIVLDGTAVQSWSAHRRIHGGIGFVPQNPVIFPSFKAERCLALGIRHLSARERTERIERVYELIPEVVPFRNRRSGLLSGGQLRMLGFAMALCGRPRLMVVDEPSAGVAPGLTARLLDTLRRLAQSEDMGVLLIEQNVQAGLRVADTVHVLRRGRMAGQFEPAELLAKENLWDLL